MAVKIITDSTGDLPEYLVKELNIRVVPLKVLFGEEVYKDGIDLTNKEFFAKMARNKQLPTTSQVNPGEFIEVFTEYLDKGDEVIGIFISSKLSGTHDSAVVARDSLDKEKIHIIDSLSASFGLALQVIEAGRMAQQGSTAREIVDKLEYLKTKVSFYGIIHQLENLKKGGRLSSTGAFAGSLLGIKPIITLKDGAVSLIAKARGQKKAFAWVLEDAKDKVDYNNKTVCFAHADSPDDLAEFKKIFLQQYKPSEIIDVEIGAVIGTHTGAGCVGVSCFTE